MYLRMSASLLIAVITSIILFALMYTLIKGKDYVDLDDKAQKIIDFIQTKQDLNVVEKQPEKPQKPEQAPIEQPDIPPPPMASQDNAIDNSVNFSAVDMAGALDISSGNSLGPQSEDGDVVAIVEAQPVYPRAAAQKGIEGYVTIKYTVTASGSVKDVVVLDANPKNVFERSAIAAAKRFKYKPKMENGQAVEFVGKVKTLKFTLRD